MCGREGGFARQRGKISQEGDSLTSSGGSQLRQFLSDFGGEGACNFQIEAFLERVPRIFFFLKLGEAETGIVVNGLGGEGIQTGGVFGELIDKSSEVVPCDAAPIKHRREVIVIDGTNEADVGVVGADGNGAVHAVATCHEVAKFTRANEGISTCEGVGASEIDEKDSVVWLFGGEFLEPSHEPASCIFVA